MSDQPDIAAVTGLVGGVMNQYNARGHGGAEEARSANRAAVRSFDSVLSTASKSKISDMTC